MQALITGASGGIGSATARRLAEDAWTLALHACEHAEAARSLATELARSGESPPFVLEADLAERGGARVVADGLQKRWDSLDLLVLNAGRYDRERFEEISDESLDRTLELNLSGPFRLVRELLPLLRRTPSGRIVFVSSVLAFTGSKHGAHYAAAKAGVLGLARSLALELAPRIAVNAIAPGSIDTAILASDTPEVRERRNREIPLGRIGTPEEVAEAIAFLGSPRASYVTGATLHVNGGLRAD